MCGERLAFPRLSLEIENQIHCTLMSLFEMPPQSCHSKKKNHPSLNKYWRYLLWAVLLELPGWEAARLQTTPAFVMINLGLIFKTLDCFLSLWHINKSSCLGLISCIGSLTGLFFHLCFSSLVNDCLPTPQRTQKHNTGMLQSICLKSYCSKQNVQIWQKSAKIILLDTVRDVLKHM